MSINRVRRNYVLVTCREWDPGLLRRIQARVPGKFYLLTEKAQLTPEILTKLRPRYVFFLHWSYYIPESIYKRYPCIVFHMTDVPFGRGGSPLQNLIERSVYQTQVSALRVVKGLDAGPVYLKRPLSLYGNAEEIYIRATQLEEYMISEIIEKEPKPKPQKGKVTLFKRRTPVQSRLNGVFSLQKIHDMIRMLDAEGYPKAFLETPHIRIEFDRSALRKGHIEATARIYPRRGRE